MKTEKELWEVVLDHQDLFTQGLCLWVAYLYFEDIIDHKEIELLDGIINSMNPVKDSDYWIGTKGEIQPRIDWINNRMKQL